MITIEAELSISDIAAQTGLTASTLRYYEQAGLLRDPVGRAPSMHRRYSRADMDWVVFVARLRSTGMPIREIRRYAELARHGDATTEQRLALLREHRERVLAQLAVVQESLATIEFKIDSYERFVTK